MTKQELLDLLEALPGEATVWLGGSGESGPVCFKADSVYFDSTQRDIIVADEYFEPQMGETKIKKP